MDHQPRGVDGHRHVGQHELDPLEGADGLAELLPFSRVGDGGIERGLGDAEPQGAGGRPRDVERAHGQLEALALGPETIGDGDRAVAEVQRHRRRGTDAHLLLFLADAEAGRALLDEERGHAPRAPTGIERREHGDHVRVVAVGAPLLGAVEHVVLAAADGRGLEAAGVGARARLGERVGAEHLARGQRRQEALLLLLGAGQQDRNAAERLVEVLRAGGRAGGGDLLAHDRQRERAHRAAAVRLGHPDAIEARLDQRADRVLRIRLGLVVARRVRRHALARDLPRQVANHALVVGEIERLVHARILYRARQLRARRLAGGGPAGGRRSPRSASSARTHQAPPKSARWRAAQTAGAGAGTLTAWRITTSYAGRYSSAITGYTTPRALSSATCAALRPSALYTRSLCSPSRGGKASGGGSPTGGGGSAIVTPVFGSRTRTRPGAISGSAITSGSVATRATGTSAPRSSVSACSLVSRPRRSPSAPCSRAASAMRPTLAAYSGRSIPANAGSAASAFHWASLPTAT